MTEHTGFELPDWLDVAARTHPDKLAISFASDRWTFAELRRSVAAAAAVLKHSQGDSAGRIGILSANRPGFAFAVHAATRLGVPFVPLNWRQSADEIAWQLREAGVTVVVTDEERHATAGAAGFGLRVTIVPIADLEHDPARLGRLTDAPRIRLDREAAVMYTSGTSGRPKGARLTYGNFWFSAIASALHLGHDSHDVWLAAMPLFHIGGLAILFRGVIGATPVVLQARFDAQQMLSAIDEGATLVSVVPFMLQRMLEGRGDGSWSPNLRRVLLGGGSVPPELVAECLRLGIPIAPTYGLTESTSQVTTLLPDQVLNKQSSAGLPLPLTEIRIVAPTGTSTPGEIGQIGIRGPTVFAGYLGDAETTTSRTADGWFETGDAGYLDDEGYLYVVDRRDDLIVSGGENVYPAEIERVLLEHPSVADAGVVGVADDTWDSRPVAAVVWQGDASATESGAGEGCNDSTQHGRRGDAVVALASPPQRDEISESAAHSVESDLLRHCAERLARYKIPDRILLLDELPRSPSGKLLRRVLHQKIAELLEDPTAEP